MEAAAPRGHPLVGTGYRPSPRRPGEEAAPRGLPRYTPDLRGSGRSVLQRPGRRWTSPAPIGPGEAANPRGRPRVGAGLPAGEEMARETAAPEWVLAQIRHSTNTITIHVTYDFLIF